MTTLTVDIEKAEDLAEVKDFLVKKGLNYETDDADKDFVYTDDIRNMLEKRYYDHMNGNVDMVSAAESERQIKELLNSKR